MTWYIICRWISFTHTPKRWAAFGSLSLLHIVKWFLDFTGHRVINPKCGLWYWTRLFKNMWLITVSLWLNKGMAPFVALFLCSKKVSGLSPRSLLSWCICGFSPDTPASSYSQTRLLRLLNAFYHIFCPVLPCDWLATGPMATGHHPTMQDSYFL